jgi:cytochrome c peroxidase
MVSLLASARSLSLSSVRTLASLLRGRCGLAVVGVPALVAGVLGASALALPPVPVPTENPITEPKRVLGKMLFFDEQLSSSDVMSCATCHVARRGGADDRIARHPGDDLILNTPDDVQGSAGIIRSDIANAFQRDPVFGISPQITDRAANTNINAAFAPTLFWDGRSTGTFRDPQTNAVLIAVGGALESQAIAPILNNVEMAHAGFSWADVTTKLARVKPLALATDLPADVAAARAARPSYAQLFQAAFGDSAITPARVAMAIATYQRTLISDQTPFDAFRAGNPNAITPAQLNGFNQFQAHRCNVCRTPAQDVFTDHSFRNIGLRPIAEDNGRQGVTGNAADRGQFKVPTLRNVTLKRTFMHNGQFTTLQQVLQFYARAPGAPVQQADNRDPVMNQIVPLPPQDSQAIIDFLSTLTDPRVANGTFPFDAPTLFVNRAADRSVIVGGGVAGAGGLVPQIIVQAPSMVGNSGYRIGLANATGGAGARLGVSRRAPVNGRITPDWQFAPITTSGAGNGAGMATQQWALSTTNVQPGEVLWAQWQVTDAAATGGLALSAVAQIRMFCGSLGCDCDPIDFNRDGLYPDDNDLVDFLSVLAGGACPTPTDPSMPACDIDFNNDGLFPDDTDLVSFLAQLAGGAC